MQQQITTTTTTTAATTATVMICDDEEDLLDIYKTALQTKYRVIAVCSGKECIETYNHEKQDGRKIDVLLLDYRLGDMLGDEVARQIREMDGTKVVIVSAYDLDEDMIRDLKQARCIVAIHKKPTTLKALIEKVDQVMAMALV